MKDSCNTPDFPLWVLSAHAITHKTDNSRQLIRNRELAHRRIEFWNLQPFRFFWYRVQRHRFAPDHVYLRYWRISMQKSHMLALRQE
jgi:hypothetical protein